MNRQWLALLGAAFLIITSLHVTPAQLAQASAQAKTALPNGVPEGAEEATIAAYNDGDKVIIEIDGARQEILLAGIDAPEPRECYRRESSDRVKALLPIGATVYLERSGTNLDGKKRPIRYLWIPSEKAGGKAILLNTKLVREGYAGFDNRKDTPKYFDRLRELQTEAQAKNAGLWGACGGVHEKPKTTKSTKPSTTLKTTTTPAATIAPPTPTPEPAAQAALITDCSPFASFDEANAYYRSRPDAQPYLDPNADGRACEVYFGVDQQLGLTSGNGGNGGSGGESGGGNSGGGGYTAGDYDCSDFSSHWEAQSAWEANGGSAAYNLWNLDADGDGVACESLP